VRKATTVLPKAPFLPVALEVYSVSRCSRHPDRLSQKVRSSTTNSAENPGLLAYRVSAGRDWPQAHQFVVAPRVSIFLFVSRGKNEFLNLVRSNEDMGKDYIIEFTTPTTEEIRNARPPAMVLPQDALIMPC
jgi:hypothetical protein